MLLCLDLQLPSGDKSLPWTRSTCCFFLLNVTTWTCASRSLLQTHMHHMPNIMQDCRTGHLLVTTSCLGRVNLAEATAQSR